jgi:hypothetical protein
MHALLDYGKKTEYFVACCGDEREAGVWLWVNPHYGFSLEDAPQLD